jgi:hypothetical protein
MKPVSLALLAAMLLLSVAAAVAANQPANAGGPTSWGPASPSPSASRPACDTCPTANPGVAPERVPTVLHGTPVRPEPRMGAPVPG